MPYFQTSIAAANTPGKLEELSMSEDKTCKLKAAFLHACRGNMVTPMQHHLYYRNEHSFSMLKLISVVISALKGRILYILMMCDCVSVYYDNVF